MKPKHWAIATPGLVLLAAFAHSAGGWAVVSVQELPEYAVAGSPVTLTYTVRQHGEELLGGLQGSVTGHAGSAKVHADAKGAGRNGYYAATLTLPNAGDWTLTIESGFRGKSKVKLLPIKVIAAGAQAPAPMTAEEKGRRLFVAKGCVTCHTHSDAKAEVGGSEGAPELTGKKFAPTYLAEFLANPKIKPVSKPNAWQMPNLALQQGEISALVAFINSDRKVALAGR